MCEVKEVYEAEVLVGCLAEGALESSEHGNISVSVTE